MKGSTALPHFYNAIRSHGVEAFTLSIDSKHSTEDDAYNRERVLIASLRNQGEHLYNVSMGGRGGTRYSVQQKLQHSQIQSRWMNTLEARAKNSAAQQRPEVRNAKSISMKNRWQTDVNLRERHQKSITTKEMLKFQSLRQADAWKDPVRRQRMLEGMHRPDVKQARRLRLSNEGNPMSKLTWEVVDEIRKSYAVHGSMKQLVMEFPMVSYPTLRRVVTNKSWIKTNQIDYGQVLLTKKGVGRDDW